MGDPDCCERCGTFWSYHDEQACADEVHRENERLRSQLEQAEQTAARLETAMRNAMDAVGLESTAIYDAPQWFVDEIDHQKQTAAGLLSLARDLVEAMDTEMYNSPEGAALVARVNDAALRGQAGEGE